MFFFKIKLISKLATIVFAVAACSCFNSSTLVVKGMNSTYSNDLNAHDIYLIRLSKIRDAELKKLNANPTFVVDSLNKVNIVDRTNESDLNRYADLMFEKINEFLSKTKDLDEKGWFDFVRDYVSTNSKNGKKQIVTENSDWFKQHENDPNYLILNTGVSGIENVAKLRKGCPPFDPKDGDYGCKDPCGRFNMRYCCITPNSLHCGFFLDSSYESAFRGGNEPLDGDIVKLALSKDAKLVDSDYLDDIFLKMFERHREEFADVLPYMADFHTIDKWHSVKPGFKMLVNFVKEKTGFDFYADELNKSCYERILELFGRYLQICVAMGKDKGLGIFSSVYGGRNGKQMFYGFELNEINLKFNEDDEKKVKEIDRLVFEVKDEPSKSEGDLENWEDKIGSRIWNLKLLCNFNCLLAKMLGFDGYYCYPKVFLKNTSDYRNLPGGEIGLSDFSNLIVCSDEFNVDEEISKLN